MVTAEELVKITAKSLEERKTSLGINVQNIQLECADLFEIIDTILIEAAKSGQREKDIELLSSDFRTLDYTCRKRGLFVYDVITKIFSDKGFTVKVFSDEKFCVKW